MITAEIRDVDPQPSAAVRISRPMAEMDLAALFDEASDAHHAYRLELVNSDDGPRVEWHTQDRGEAVTHSVEPAASPWLKLWRAVLGAIIPEHLL